MNGLVGLRLPVVRAIPAGLAAALVTLASSPAALAQTAAPITVTPPTLAPAQRESGFRVDIPEAGGLRPPAGSEALAISLANVSIEGAFPEVDTRAKAITATIKGRSVTLAEIYAAASAIEAEHARAGFILARVSVPAQDLNEGGTLRIVVTDGFIEMVDVAGLPGRVRGAVERRAGGLAQRGKLKIAAIEQPLLIASDVPGLTLRSTLMRGEQQGGTRLVLEGTHRPVTGSVNIDNGLDPALDGWGIGLQLALNSLLGRGEQVYGFFYGGYDPGQWLRSEAPVRVSGGGAIIPLGEGRLSLNPEVTFSRTLPAPEIGAPRSKGALRRLTLRANYLLSRSQTGQSGVSLTLEQIEEALTAPDFGVDLTRNRYMTARLGASLSRRVGEGLILGVSAQLSQGLGDFGAISSAEAAASGTPYSRQGSSNGFSRLTAQAFARMPLGDVAEVLLQTKGQTSFGKPLFRAEQFSLEGPDAVSAYIGGMTAVDEGLAGRFELALAGPAAGSARASVAPYVFVAGGTGWIKAPTVLEPGRLSAGAAGIGARMNFADGRLGLNLEFAHGFSSHLSLASSDRANVSATFRF